MACYKHFVFHENQADGSLFWRSELEMKEQVLVSMLQLCSPTTEAPRNKKSSSFIMWTQIRKPGKLQVLPLA